MRVLIMRPDNLGDLVLFSGAVQVMREAWPEAHITLCARGFGRELFRHCPCIDEFLPYESLRWAGRVPWPMWFSRANRGEGWMRRLYGTGMGRLNYDLAVLPLLSPFRKYHRAMQVISAGRRVGIAGRLDSQSAEEERQYSAMYDVRVDGAAIAAGQAELETHRVFLRALGIECSIDDVWPRFWTSGENVAEADRLLEGLGGLRRRILGITPGAASPAGMKTLPGGWYGEVLRRMEVADLDVVVLGAEQDAGICGEVEAVLRNQGHRVVNLAVRTSILTMVEVIRRCDAMLCIDAAPLPIAVGLRRPVAGVIGGGHFGRFYPWGDKKVARVVNKPMDCYGCGWDCKYETVRCVQEISPELAARELGELLNGKGMG